MLCKIKHLFDTADTAREHTNETSAVSAKTLDEKIPQSIIITQAIQTRLWAKCVLRPAFYWSWFDYADEAENYRRGYKLELARALPSIWNNGDRKLALEWWARGIAHKRFGETEFEAISFRPSWSFHLHFLQILSLPLTALILANTVVHVGPLNQIGHPADSYKRYEQVLVVSANGILIGTKTLLLCSDRYNVFVFNF